MADVYIKVVSYRAFLTHPSVPASMDTIFPGCKYIGVKGREPAFKDDWKVGDPQQPDIAFVVEIIHFQGTIEEADLQKFTTNETTKQSVLVPFFIVKPKATAEADGPGVKEEVPDAPAAAAAAATAATAAAAAATAAPPPPPPPAPVPAAPENPKEIPANEYDGIDSPKEYTHMNGSAAFMTNTNGRKQYWVATGSEKEVLELVRNFNPPA